MTGTPTFYITNTKARATGYRCCVARNWEKYTEFLDADGNVVYALHGYFDYLVYNLFQTALGLVRLPDKDEGGS
jgi:hypothetical protein